MNACTLNKVMRMNEINEFFNIKCIKGVIQKQFLKTIQGLLTNKSGYPRITPGRKLRFLGEKMDLALHKNTQEKMRVKNYYTPHISF